MELPLRGEAAVVELPRRAEAAAVELLRRAEALVAELPRRAEAAYAPRCLEACSQEALKRCRTADCRRCYPWRYRCRWLFRHAAGEAHDCPAELQCCRCRSSYRRRRYPRCPVTARQGVCDCREASRCWLQVHSRARGARRLHTGKRVITLNGRGIAGTGFCTLTRRRRVAGRCAAGMTDVVALRGNRGNRRTRMRGDDAGTAHLRRVRGRRNGGMAVIVVERQRRIFRRHLHVLRLLRRRRHVLLVDGGNLLRRRLRCRATGAPIVTHVGDVVDDDGLVVDVADLHVRDVVDGAVVEESAATPIAALVAVAGVAVAIRDAAVEADFRAPIAFVKGIDAVVPTPIAGRPQQRWLRWQCPRARHPVVARIVIPGPIARRPDVTWRWDRRLIVNRQWRRRDIDSYAIVLSISRCGRTIVRRNSEPCSVRLL